MDNEQKTKEVDTGYLDPMSRANKASIEGTVVELKVGDRVWVSGFVTKKWHLTTVEKITSSYIFLQGFNQVYKKSTWMKRDKKGTIITIATPEECAAQDAVSEARAQAQRERDAIQEQRRALERQFESLVTIEAEGSGTTEEREGKLSLTLHFLTEEQISAIALAIRGAKR